MLVIYYMLSSLALCGQNMSVLWVSCYKGPGSNEGYPVDLVADDSGYVYLTGVSEGKPLRPHESGSIYRDIATLKYTSEGVQVWAARFEGTGNNSIDEPSNIAVSMDGCVVVSGISYNSDEKWAKGVILKYSPEGKLLWKKISDSDRYTGVCFDMDGNLYAVKTSYTSKNNALIGVVKLDNSGREIWSLQKDSEAKVISTLLLDNTNSCLFLCEGEKRITKYTYDGQKVWEMPYTSIEIHSRNLYSMQRKNASSFAISQYNLDSQQKWDFVFQSEGILRNTTLETDHNGNVYLCGTSEHDNVMKIVLSKYSNGGIQDWTKCLEGNTYSVDFKVRGKKLYVLGSILPDMSNNFMAGNSFLCIFNEGGELIDTLKSATFGVPHKLFIDTKHLYVVGGGGLDKGEYLVAKISASEEAKGSGDKNDILAKDIQGIPAPSFRGNAIISEYLSDEQLRYAGRMYEYLKAVCNEFKTSIITDQDTIIPDRAYESDVYKKWGLGPKREFTLEEKYYIMNLHYVDSIWHMYNSIDLNNLSASEQDFLERTRNKYGEHSVNLRQTVIDEGKQLDSNQKLFFDLIKAVTGDDTLDDLGLVFSYRIAPK